MNDRCLKTGLLLSFLAVTLACGDPLVAPELITGNRVLAARVQVATDANSAWVMPAEAGRVRWLVASPAGPPALTGAEKFPADTQISGGAPPQTVVVTTCQLGGGSLDVISMLAGVTTDTVRNQTCYYIIDGSGTISAMTLTMPAAPLDGQILRISAKVAVTTLTMAANTNQTLAGAATSASANAAVGAWIYRQTTATAGNWYRVQ